MSFFFCSCVDLNNIFLALLLTSSSSSTWTDRSTVSFLSHGKQYIYKHTSKRWHTEFLPSFHFTHNYTKILPAMNGNSKRIKRDGGARARAMTANSNNVNGTTMEGERHRKKTEAKKTDFNKARAKWLGTLCAGMLKCRLWWLSWRNIKTVFCYRRQGIAR